MNQANLLLAALCCFPLPARAATPLEAAAAAGRLDDVKALLADGAEVDATDPNSTWERTPLIAAAMKGQVAVVEVLLAAGADPNLQDMANATALRRAAQEGHAEVAERLLRAGADPEKDTDYYQRSPLVWTVISAKGGDAAAHARIVELLVQAGAKCPQTFIHPTKDIPVSLRDRAAKAGPEVGEALDRLCPGH